MLAAFQHIVREPNLLSIWWLWLNIRDQHPLELIDGNVLMSRRAAWRRLPREYLLGFKGSALQLGHALALPLAHHWTERVGSGFTIVHDESTAVSKERELWDSLTSPTTPEGIVGGGGG